MNITFFQYLPKFNDVRYNLDFIKQLVEKNQDTIRKSQLLIFPEYAFSGPLDLKTFNNYQQQIKNIRIENEFKKISKLIGKIYIIFGSLILKEKNFYVNASLVYYNGSKIGQYNKKALIYNENYICRATPSYPIFIINNIKVGIAICWDLILPEIFRHYAGKADLVVVPSFWGIGGNALQEKYSFSLEKKYYREIITARAYENAFGVLFVNSVGQYKSDFYTDRMMGGSMAILPPLGEIMFINDKDNNKIHSVDFDFKYLEQFREYYATDKDYDYYKSKKIF